MFAAAGTWCGALALPAVLLFSSLAALVYALTLKLVLRRPVTADSMIAFGRFWPSGSLLSGCCSKAACLVPPGSRAATLRDDPSPDDRNRRRPKAARFQSHRSRAPANRTLVNLGPDRSPRPPPRSA
ncbi:MAG: prepilin peptidase [Oceanicaulis sp.]|nr:prepilin peptidase [Oceanicaulis sp.]